LKEIYFYERDKKTNETIIYTNTLVAENYGINGSFFDKNAEALNFGKVISKRKTEVFNGNTINDGSLKIRSFPDVSIKKVGNVTSLDKANFEVTFKDVVSLKPLQERVSTEELGKYLKYYELYYVEKYKKERILNWFPHFGEINITYLDKNFKMLPIQFMIVEMFTNIDEININRYIFLII
jgi:hypothetical protein